MGEWEIRVTNELFAWIKALDERSKAQVGLVPASHTPR
jgi:hypothetical protein